MGSLGTKYQTVDVEVDLDDVIDDLTDKELLAAGLMRVAPSDRSGGYGNLDGDIARPAHNALELDLQEQWLVVRMHLRNGNIDAMLDQLNVMAWNQSHVMLPITAKLAVVA